MAVVLIRHAEDRAAAAGRFGNEGLSASGVKQARRLGRALAKAEFSLCLVSPLERAMETAEIAFEGRELPLRVVPELAEGSLGDLDGLSVADAAKRYPEDFALGTSVVARIAAVGRTAPGGESRQSFLARARASAQIVSGELEERESDIVLIAHGGLLNYLLQVALGVPIRDAVPFGFDHCGGVRLLRWTEGKGFGPFPMLRFAAFD